MPPKESLFSTFKKTVVFFRLTRTYLRYAALATRAWRRLDGVSRGGGPNYGAYLIWTRQGTFAATPSRPKAVRLIAAVGDYVVSAEPRPKILRAQRYGSKCCDLSLTAFHRFDV